MIRRRVIAHGRVQGVFFRDTVRRQAHSRGVAGWVRNLPDGTVESVFEGERDAVEAMVRKVERGPGKSHVEHLEQVDETPEWLSGFVIR